MGDDIIQTSTAPLPILDRTIFDIFYHIIKKIGGYETAICPCGSATGILLATAGKTLGIHPK